MLDCMKTNVYNKCVDITWNKLQDSIPFLVYVKSCNSLIKCHSEELYLRNSSTLKC